MSTSLRLILELQSKTTLLEQSSTKTGPLEAATLDHRPPVQTGTKWGSVSKTVGHCTEMYLKGYCRDHIPSFLSAGARSRTPLGDSALRVSRRVAFPQIPPLFYSVGVQSIFVGVIYPSLFAWVCTVLSDRLGCVADLNTPPEDLFEIPDIPSRMIGIEVAEKRAVLHLPGICNDPDVT